MIGIVLSGHGRFASGLSSALNLIAGEQAHLEVVDFEHEVDQLTKDLQAAFDRLSDCAEIVVLTDLPGGSPFKTAATLAKDHDHMHVYAGLNMPMLAELVMARSFIDDVDTLMQQAMESGKSQIVEFSLPKKVNDNDDFSEGI